MSAIVYKPASTLNKLYVCFEQHVNGNEHAEGNVKITEKPGGFRVAVDIARVRARELRLAGRQVMVLKDLLASGAGFGYRIIEPPTSGDQPGRQWNLLVIEATS